MERKQFTFYRSYYEALTHLKKQDQAAVYAAICAYALDEQEPDLTGAAAAAFTLIRPTLDAGRRKAENRTRKETAPENKPITNGEQTEIKRRTKRNQTGNKPGTSEKQTVKEKEREKEIESEREVEIEKESSISLSPLPPLGAPPTPAGADICPEQGVPDGAAIAHPLDAQPRSASVGAAASCPQGAPLGRTPVGAATSRPSEPPLSALSPALAEKARQWLQYKAERREAYKPTGLLALVSRIQTNAAQYGDAAVTALIDLAMSSNYAGIPWDRLPQQAAKAVRLPGGSGAWDNREPSDWQRDAVQRMMAREDEEQEERREMKEEEQNGRVL